MRVTTFDNNGFYKNTDNNVDYQCFDFLLSGTNVVPSSTLYLVQLSVLLVVGFFVICLDNLVDNLQVLSVGFGAIINSFDLTPKTDIMYEFTAAYLNDKKGDLSKRWYISFEAWHVQEHRKKRKWDYSVNKFKTNKERYSYAKSRIKDINRLLKQGFHFDESVSVEKTENDYTVESGLKFSLSTYNNAHETLVSYSSRINLFLSWAKTKNYQTLPFQAFTSKMAYQYRDYMVSQNKAGVTINNERQTIQNIWGNLIDREEMKVENPWKRVKKEKEIKSYRNIAFTWGEVKTLTKLAMEMDLECWYFCVIMYHTFSRKTEIRQLKVKDILLAQRKIYINAKIAKNKVERYVTVHDSLIDTLIPLIGHKSGDEYLFPGKRAGTCISKNQMTIRLNKILEAAELKDSDHTLYSWKHTGVVQAYLAGVDIKSIQLQCGHASITETDNYLKSLGLYDNHDIIIKQPALP